MADPQLKRHIVAVCRFLLALVVVQLLYLIKLSIWDSSALSEHPLNTRAIRAAGDVQRGRILDCVGRVLAQSDSAGHRTYPYGAALTPVTGYDTEQHGAAGIERTEGAVLSGMTEDLLHMGPLAALFRADVGCDIHLTVDAELSHTVWDALGTRRGAVVVLEAETGAVLAMVSTPSVSPAEIEEHWAQLLSRADSPLLNRALQGLYPPGSIVKPIIADAALSSGAVRLDELFTCTGALPVGTDYVIHESHRQAHGNVYLPDALRVSCNVVFADLALRLGSDGIKKALTRFGIGEEMQTRELSMSVAHVPALADLSDGEIAQLGIGQGQLLVTPFQMALIADAFANGGRIERPYMVQSIVSHGGAVLYEAHRALLKEATTPERAAVIDDFMQEAVSAGTGTAAYVKGIRVTGKTGTAEHTGGADHAWFVGSAAHGARKIVFSVLVEEGGFGGVAAAKIARQVIEKYFEGCVSF